MDLKLVHGDALYVLTVDAQGKEFHIKVDDREYHISQVEYYQTMVTFVVKGVNKSVYYIRNKDGIHVNSEGTSYTFSQSGGPGVRHQHAGTTKSDSVMSPMPGLVVKIPVNPGDEVSEGATLAIVEAMKMQNELRAPRKGIVKKINFKEGEQVDALQPIVELEKT